MYTLLSNVAIMGHYYSSHNLPSKIDLLHQLTEAQISLLLLIQLSDHDGDCSDLTVAIEGLEFELLLKFLAFFHRF